MGQEKRDGAPRTLVACVAAGALAGIIAGAHDVLLGGGDLTGDPLSFLTRWALAAAVYVPIGVVLAIPFVLIARPFGGAGEGTERRAALGAWWLSVAALAMLALELPRGLNLPAAVLLGYAAMVPVSLLGIRALRVVARAGAGRPAIAGLYAGGVTGVVGAIIGGRIANSSLPVPDALSRLVVIAVAAISAFVGMVAVRAILSALGGRIGERRAQAVAIAVVAALVIVGTTVKLIQEASTPGLREELARLADAGGTAGDRPSVVLISVDTLRGDSVGYAGGRARTPTMDALADESWVFENAHSVAPWTVPSFASFFSSRYPSEMGVARAKSLFGSHDRIIPWAWTGEAPVLPEVLREEGYATGAVTSNAALSASSGAQRGFDAYYSARTAGSRQFRPHDVGEALDVLLAMLGRPRPNTHDYERADTMTRVGIKLFEALAGSSAPVLAWVHYIDPHHPYDSPEAGPEETADLDVHRVMSGWTYGSAVERAQVVNAYDAEIEYFDEYLQTELDALRSTGLWDRSIVVFWSDHGEEFWEHEGWGHGQSLHNEIMRVPLMIHLPGQTEGHRVNTPVTLLDVAPTVLELCGVDEPDGMRGRSLAPIFDGHPERMAPLSVGLESCLYGGIRKGLLRGNMKLVHNLYPDTWELYDVQADPMERTNLYGVTQSPEIAQMRADLVAFTEESLARMEDFVSREGAGEVSPEALDSLRDMGYIQ